MDTTVDIALSDPVDGPNNLGRPRSGRPPSAVLTIHNDEPGVFAIGSATYGVNESDGSITIPVYRTVGTDGAVSVPYSTADGTAVSDTSTNPNPSSNYQATSGTLSFAVGQTVAYVTVPIHENHLVQGDRTFTLSLGSPTNNGTLGSPATTAVTIADSDFAAPSAFQVNHGNAGKSFVRLRGHHDVQRLGRVPVGRSAPRRRLAAGVEVR